MRIKLVDYFEIKSKFSDFCDYWPNHLFGALTPISSAPLKRFGFIGKDLCGTQLSWFHFVKVMQKWD